MDPPIDPYLTPQDTIVLKNLALDITQPASSSTSDATSSIKLLEDQNDEKSDEFEPSVFSSWELKDLERRLPGAVNQLLLQPYVRWAKTVVRRQTDIVFLTHIIIYFSTSVPSAILLYYHFSWWQTVLHLCMQGYYMGPFTLMLHNHIHNNGVLSKGYKWFDLTFPYILEPLMGHSWDSYYYHHVKHHHVEGNGPDDLSSTVRYQRDELLDFAAYTGRFLLFVWLELPMYFLRKNRHSLAVRTFVSEVGTYLFIYGMARYNLRATTFVLMLPLLFMRLAMMTGNWGQHALVDEIDPDSAMRSSITLIDVPSNRFCFNDGYHTSHHLNPRRHWRDHPAHFLKAKNQYSSEKALTFRDIDFFMMTVTLLRKDYVKLARCLVPMGEQIGKSQEELQEMLRMKTRRFTEEEINAKFGKTIPTLLPKPQGITSAISKNATARRRSIIHGRPNIVSPIEAEW